MTYVLLDMVRVFFPSSGLDGRTPAPPTFFSKPPVGYALLAFPHVGYYVSIEWIGKLLIAPASAPFFLGSAAHAAAAAALPDVTYDDAPLAFGADDFCSWVASDESDDGVQRVGWATQPSGGRFYKLVRGHAHASAFFSNAYAAYTHLAQLLRAVAPEARPPALPADASLRYGAHAVLVDLPWAAGRHARDAEMRSDDVLGPVAAAVAWLARRRLVYCDVRAPNVLVEPGTAAVHLVDYDDCFVVANPVTTFEGYVEALRMRTGSRHGCQRRSDILVAAVQRRPARRGGVDSAGGVFNGLRVQGRKSLASSSASRESVTVGDRWQPPCTLLRKKHVVIRWARRQVASRRIREELREVHRVSRRASASASASASARLLVRGCTRPDCGHLAGAHHSDLAPARMDDAWDDVDDAADPRSVGADDGWHRGVLEGFADGYALGCDRGSRIGEELGFYAAAAAVIAAALDGEGPQADEGVVAVGDEGAAISAAGGFEASPSAASHRRPTQTAADGGPPGAGTGADSGARSRARLAAGQVRALVAAYPLANPADFDVLAALDRVRAKFKACAAHARAPALARGASDGSAARGVRLRPEAGGAARPLFF